MNLTIRFAKYGSPTCDMAVFAAKIHHSFKEVEYDKVGKLYYELSIDLPEDNCLAQQVLHFVRGIKSTIAIINHNKVVDSNKLYLALMCEAEHENIRCNFNTINCKVCIRHIENLKVNDQGEAIKNIIDFPPQYH